MGLPYQDTPDPRLEFLDTIPERTEEVRGITLPEVLDALSYPSDYPYSPIFAAHIFNKRLGGYIADDVLLNALSSLSISLSSLRLESDEMREKSKNIPDSLKNLYGRTRNVFATLERRSDAPFTVGDIRTINLERFAAIRRSGETVADFVSIGFAKRDLPQRSL